MSLKNRIIATCLMLITVFMLTGCENKEASINNKAKSEVEYLSTKFIDILNKMNNITFENYIITAKNVGLSRESANESQTGSSSSTQTDVAKVEKDEEKSSITSMQMSPNTILNQTTKEIDWPELKNDIENLYYSWNTILLDLYQINVPNDKILGFSSDLDKATICIKNEDKTNGITAIANLYEYLPVYAEQIFSENAKKNIIKTKAFVIKAYSLIEIPDWNNVKNEISKALEAFGLVATDANYVIDNSYKVNKCYVLLNELNNSLNLKDKDIFYIKYKNLIEELNNL